MVLLEGNIIDAGSGDVFPGTVEFGERIVGSPKTQTAMTDSYAQDT